MHKPNIGCFGWICVLQMWRRCYFHCHMKMFDVSPPFSTILTRNIDSWLIHNRIVLFCFVRFKFWFVHLFRYVPNIFIYLVLLRWAIHIVHDKLPNSNVELLTEGIWPRLQILDLFTIGFYSQHFIRPEEKAEISFSM